MVKKSKQLYEKNIENSERRKREAERKAGRISILRLFTVLLAIACCVWVYKTTGTPLVAVPIIAGLVVFTALLQISNTCRRKIEKEEAVIFLNKLGIARIERNFKAIENDGSIYAEKDHPFADDLDIFGKNSLFKLINTCSSKGGEKKLADILKQKKIFNETEIRERQKAVKELAEKTDFRHRLQLAGALNKNKDGEKKIEEFIKWSRKAQDNSKGKYICALIFIALMIIFCVLTYLGIMPVQVLVLDLLVNFTAVKVMMLNSRDEFDMFLSIKSTIEAYSEELDIIQNEKFESYCLQEIYKNLSSDNADCRKELKKLNSIIAWIGSKNNAYYFLFNLFFLADIILTHSIYKWNEAYGKNLEKWFEVIYNIDELASFANFAYEQEEWTYPEISEKMELDAVKMGHPILGDKGTRNTFSLKDNKKIALITGSNMSGKSTFLRTAGLNLLLSYTGTVVCAESFKCGIMKLYTCMRTKDNLEESISSFYAEILRIKILIEASKKGKKLFVLLDEIFKGTNSEDRHTGASVLIRQLIAEGAVGLVSTHDFELCDMEKEDNRIVNYNFREYYEDNKIKFDYILRKGKSETRNAVHLMRLAGIEIK